MFHKIAGGKKQKAEATKATARATAAKAIPLDDDKIAGTDNLKEFNS